MAYLYDLGTGQRIFLDNQGTQTTVTTTFSGAGQQQQASSSFQTGPWTASPQAFPTSGGMVIKLHTATGERLIQIQGSSVSTVNIAPPMDTAQPLPAQQVDSPTVMQPMQPMAPMPPMQPMQPMQPMPPMTMGNMTMGLNPMEMRMGDMEMRMGTAVGAPGSSANSSSVQSFCTQCGTAVKPMDRFCAHCGNPLQPSA